MPHYDKNGISLAIDDKVFVGEGKKRVHGKILTLAPEPVLEIDPKGAKDVAKATKESGVPASRTMTFDLGDCVKDVD